MGTNELLYESGLLDQFEAAAQREDAKTMADLLERAGLPSSHVEAMARATIFQSYLARCRKDLDAMPIDDVARVFVARFDGKQPDLAIGKANLVELIMGDIRLSGS